MSFFKKLFGSSEDKTDDSLSSTNVSSIKPSSLGRKPQFGRYTDMNKTKAQLAFWDKSVNEFKDKKYLDSFKSFIKYCGDDLEKNYTLTETSDGIEFEFVQGSKTLKGNANDTQINVESRVVSMEKPSVPVMRKLMNINFGLTYSHFSLKDNIVYLKFSSHSIDASPNKLYSAIKELATNSDKQDDLLVSEFSAVQEIDTDHVIKLSEQTINTRYSFLTKWINDVLNEINKLDANKDSGGIAFLLLSLSYKIDYLLISQGQLMDKLEKIQRIFFAKNNETTPERNNKIISEFNKIISSPKEKITEGFYEVKSTFALARPSTHKQLMDFIYGEIDKANWYRNNNYPQIVNAIYEYAVSSSFFNFGMTYPDAQLLDIYMNVLNPDYYSEMGIDSKYIENGKLNGKTIINQVNAIVNNAKTDYPFIRIDTNLLNFNSIVDFGNTLFKVMDVLDYRKQ